MRPLIPILLLFLASFTFAFDVEDYLYYNEDITTVTEENFTLNGVDYLLIKINGDEIFLLKGNKVLNSSENVTPVVRAYYKSLYYPTDEELVGVDDLLLSYNTSRNDGEGIYPGKEEASCRYVLFLDGHIDIGGQVVQCIDDESCALNARLVFQAYGGASAFGTYDTVLGPLKAYAYATQETEQIMQESFLKFNNINEDNAHEVLQYIKDSIPTLRIDKTTVETSFFRTPLNTPQDQAACQSACYPLCPQMNYNDTALDSLETELDGILQRIQPFAEHDTISLHIVDETTTRINFRDLENKARIYFSVFSTLEEDGQRTTQHGEDVLSIILNLSLQSKLDRLDELGLRINQSIDQRNFTSIDDDLNEYEQLIEEIEDTIPDALSLYNQSLEARQDATVMLLLLETKDLDNEEEEELTRLRAYYTQLDTLFTPGLTSNDYVNITNAYQAVSQQARITLKSHDEDPLYFASSKFRGLSRRIGRGVSSLAVSTSVLQTQQIGQDNNFLIGFSVISFISLTSLAMVIVLSYFLTRSKITKLSIAGGALAIVIITIGILTFSALLYHFLNKASNDADLYEFLYDLQSRNNTVIAVDTTGSVNASTPAMLACADSVSASLASMNKSVTIYQLDEGDCSAKIEDSFVQKNSSYCMESMNHASSLFVLNYSDETLSPHFYTIFSNKMEASGNEDYYEACSISLLFRG